MGNRNHPVASELRDRLPESTDEHDGIFHTDLNETHVIVKEDEIGKFYKALREMGLESRTFRGISKGETVLRGYVED